MAVTYSKLDDELMQLTLQLRQQVGGGQSSKYHGDKLVAGKVDPVVGLGGDIMSLFTRGSFSSLYTVISDYFGGKGLNAEAAAHVAGSLSNYSKLRQRFINSQVKEKYDKMLHPPLTYLGDAFAYRTADGTFNSALNPKLGAAGGPYARTVPSVTSTIGALPDPGDLFDKLLARQGAGRESESGLSSMLLYHATIIIHDVFRTNDHDKNISDSSSYLDLSPLYGYTADMVKAVRDRRYGLLKADTFAEDRLLRQPPGVCVMLVMYNRYHNFAARNLLKINENGRFSLPAKYTGAQLVALAKHFYPPSTSPVTLKNFDKVFLDKCDNYEKALKAYEAAAPYDPSLGPPENANKSDAKTTDSKTPDNKSKATDASSSVANPPAPPKSASPWAPTGDAPFDNSDTAAEFRSAEQALISQLDTWNVSQKDRVVFEAEWDAAVEKQSDDLFNTARLITCGMYVQISVHDYLRALMGFAAHDSTFTLDPRADFDGHSTTRGLGNQVTAEFNCLYRFHTSIPRADELYTEDYMRTVMNIGSPRTAELPEFMAAMGALRREAVAKKAAGVKETPPHEVTFGIPGHKKYFTRNKVTNLFDDEKLIGALTEAMDSKLCQFGPRNTPTCMKAIEVLGIQQARAWNVATLNDFRAEFGMPRHTTFATITGNKEVQDALRDLYEHPDQIELYPGIFCETDERPGSLDNDPGPRSGGARALWVAIFSDAITLVRSDRFYTTDWNTNSLTSWGMSEVSPDFETLKSSVFHRLIQRAFPGWYPPDSLRFFHPFYTGECNAKFAKAQGYDSVLRMTTKRMQDGTFKYDYADSEPSKPVKPVYLDNFKDIKVVLKNKSKFQHPALISGQGLPPAVSAVLQSGKPSAPDHDFAKHIKESEAGLRVYLQDLMQVILKRESISMAPRTPATFQIDITRDFAIPVVATFVSDFLGIGATLKSGLHSENEIYEHISNCQTYLAYNSDETKMLRRRTAFQKSMHALLKLIRKGTVKQASQWAITKACFGRSDLNAMEKLGLYVAEKILAHEGNTENAAAIMLLVCLDLAFNSVVAFSAVIDHYMEDLSKVANAEQLNGVPFIPEWQIVQNFAFSEDADALAGVEMMVMRTAHVSIATPTIRKAIDDCTINVKPKRTVTKGETVILDFHAATMNAIATGDDKDIDFLAMQPSLSESLGNFYPRHFSALALTEMVQFVARMKTARRGHDAQGLLKTIDIEESAEGYSNWMSAERVAWIAKRVQALPEGHPDKTIYTDDVLRPAAKTYLNTLWTETCPAPTTFKLRFDGLGRSDYTKDGYAWGKVRRQYCPDSFPPFYQPRGPSHYGGAFGNVPKEESKPEAPTATATAAPALTATQVPSAALLAGCKLPSPFL